MLLRRSLPVAATAVTATLFARTAGAHAIDPRMGDFYAGLLHPLTAPEHILPILALGLLVGQRGLQRAQAVLLIFPALFAAGAALAIVVLSLPWLFAINILWAVLLGGLVAAAPRTFPLIALYGLAGGMAVSHGYANGQAMTADSKALLFIAGLTFAAFLALGYVSLVADFILRQKPTWLRIAVRACGSWIAAIGILVLSLAHRSALSS